MMSEKIELVLVKRKMSKSALAEALNSSPSNLYNKFKRDNWTEKEFHKISVDRLNGINAEGQTSIFTDFENL